MGVGVQVAAETDGQRVAWVLNGDDKPVRIVVVPAAGTDVAKVNGFFFGDGDSVPKAEACLAFVFPMLELAKRVDLTVDFDLELFAVPAVDLKEIEFDCRGVRAIRKVECLACISPVPTRRS